MKLCIDAQPLQGDSAQRGVGRYSRGLAEAVIRSGRAEVSILLNTALSERYEQVCNWASSWIPQSRIYQFCGPVGIRGLNPDSGRTWQAASALYDCFLQKSGVKSVYTGAPFDGMGDDTAIGAGSKEFGYDGFRMGTLYDLIPFQQPQQYLSDRRYNQWFYSRLNTLKSYDLIFSISDYTREAAIDFGFSPDQVVSISADTNNEFRPILITQNEEAQLLKQYGVSKNFIMHTGILEGRKNVKTLIAAFAALPPHLILTHQLVFVAHATPSQKSDIIRSAAHLGLPSNSIVFTGFMPDRDLAKFYNLTRALVMPSTSEGFGLPLLEAMRCGAPALGANATSIPEVVGHEDYLFNPAKPQELAEKLRLVLEDEGFERAARLHSSVQQAKFSWDRSAKLMLDAWQTMYREKSGRTSNSRIRYYFQANPDDQCSTHAAVVCQSDLAPLKHSKLRSIAELPVLITGTSGLSSSQEASILSQPFGVLVEDPEAELECSPEVLYGVKGYIGLLALRSGGESKVRASSLGELSQCFFLGGHRTDVNDVLETGDKTYYDLLQFIQSVPKDIEHEFACQFSALAQINLVPAKTSSTMYVDVSELVHRDARTGIQRVVRSVLFNLIAQSSEYRIEPVYREGDHYKLARAFTAKFLGIPSLALPDSYVSFKSGDIFLGLDLDALISPACIERLRRERLRGVRIAWIVYDLLPLEHPEWFDKPMAHAVKSWVNRISREADHLICISKAVADSLISHLEINKPERCHELDISWWHLGSDIDGSAPTKGISVQERAQLQGIPRDMPLFITVGTIEPRKGIEKLLAGAEAFWSSGGKGAFVLVGKPGWNVDALLSSLRSHPEINKRLFWFDGVSDELLRHLYTISDAAIFPSQGEGFGLPLVEAASHQKPILARDLAVFREIAGENAYYFKGEDASSFASELKAWIALFEAQRHPLPNLRLQTWGESTRSLYKIVTERNKYRKWSPLTP